LLSWKLFYDPANRAEVDCCGSEARRGMQETDYFVVDVFTETALAGNPLAVVMNPGGLSTERMQAIAREFNLSETTFVERRPLAVEQAEGVRVRIFTTQGELNFAGHPTLGTASVLRMHAPDAMQTDTVTLTLNVGPVPVRFDPEGFFGEMTQQDPEFGGELDPAEVARLCGLRTVDFCPEFPPQVVSTGTAFAIVLLNSLEALARLRVNQQEATPWLRERGARWFYVLADGDAEGRAGLRTFRARMQFHGGEDPATGSAAGCAIAYLVLRGAVASGQRVHLRQGMEIGRPSDLFVSARAEPSREVSDLFERPETVTQSHWMEQARVTGVRVGGSTVPVAKGRLFLS